MTASDSFSPSLQNTSYQATAPFYVLGELSPATTDIWLVFHGYGQLGERFIQKFGFLVSETTAIVAPQGPDRFYFDHFRKVGASWTTRNQRETHLYNQQAYLDAMWAQVTASISSNKVRIHSLAFSQGVSVQTRWLSSRKVEVEQLIFWAGGYPHDIERGSWGYLSEATSIRCIVGESDEFLTPERMEEERTKILSHHPQAEFVMFEGKHEMPANMMREMLGKGIQNAE